MADLTKSLLDAISIIATKSADEVSSDKTIKATVKKVVSTSEGKYLVSYNDGSFYAYVQPGSTDLYQVDEQIYILVPAGDMSQKKFIIGKVGEVEERSSSKILASSLLNDYVMIGENAVIENTYKENEADIHVKRMQPLALNSHKINDFYYCYLHNPDEVNSLLESKGISIEHNYNTFAYPCLDIDDEVFSNSAKQAEALLIRAKFKTSIDTNTIGNYGIIVNIAFADETNPQTDDDGNVIVDANGNAVYTPKTIAYVLDTSKMTGNPMKFYDYTSQYTIAAFNGEKYLYIDSIIAFSEGFVSEDTEAHNNIDDVNIYIDGLEIIALDEISAINGDYKLKLTAPRGNTIRAGQKDSLKIAAEVTYLNQDISKNTDFYWGVKDPSIVSTSDNYNAKLGSGYRYLENENKKELVLSSGSLTAAENIYICVAVYESNIILKTSISLYNNNNKLNITIDSDQGTSFQFNEGNPVLTCLINGKDHNYQESYSDNAFSFIWSKEDEELGTIILNKTKAQLEADRDRELQECQANSNNHLSSAGRSILEVTSYYSTQIAQIKDVSYPQGPRGPKINCKLKNVNTYVIYSCSVYRGGIYVGYASITLQNSRKVVNNNYYVTITNGSQVFQYDEGGVAPNSQKNQEPINVLSLTAVFHSPQGTEVTPKKVRWIVPEGKTLIKIPRLGLKVDPETGEKYFSGNTYPLNIKDIYDSNCNDNQLIAIVTHNDGTEYRQSTNLLFTKIGEIGTNGTNTTVKIDELPNVPKEECLTIIKDVVNEENRIFYNGYKSNINTELASSNNPVLKASLYTNNSEVLGYSTKWTIAGTSKTYGKNYEVSASSDDVNRCTINYNNHNNELDTRIIRAQINFGGKYFYSFYGLPAIEYSDGYNYGNYPIKIMQDGTLRTVLYDSGGTNPTYTTGCGVHVELPENSNTIGFLDWEIEDGANFSLAKSPKLKQGSEKLEISTESESIKQAVKTAHDKGIICANEAPADIKEYINEFLTDIERTCLDSILSVSSKLESLWNRLAVFESESPDKTNIAIKTVYEEYYSLFDKMDKEYKGCAKENEDYIRKYTAVQNIWNSEWPEVIFGTRLHISSSSNETVHSEDGESKESIDTIQKLINKYKQAYNHRLDDNSEINYSIDRNNLFDNYFKNILEKYQWSFNDYNPILNEYIKVLIAYINVLINETREITKELKHSRYESIYEIWPNIEQSENSQQENENENLEQNENENVEQYEDIEKYAEDILKSCEDNISNIYDGVRDLYNYYQGLFLGIKRNRVAQDSETLNIWNAILRNQNPDLLNQIYVIPNDNFNGLRMNNNVIGTVYTKNNNSRDEIAKIYVPIIMTLNTYELAALNGWDGTNVEIGDNHIMTPQIGAGIKDDTTNTFTGMAMGVIGSTVESKDDETIFDKANKTDKIGLIGYHNGQQSMFIDAKTGKAIFGLPSEDNGFDEGRIELNPGGVSKIGNWKIGNRFLYNIVDGTYELRKDIDANPSHKESKIMVPHDKHGIVLSSDQPYIHVKGEVYENNNLISIDYADEYNNINPRDSLELRIDPGNNSLFSIVQHTTGFGDEDPEDLLFGYKANSAKGWPVIKKYIPNQNIEEYGETGQTGSGAEYYIYRLEKDAIGNYYPYYQQNSVSNFTKNIYNINENSSNFKIESTLLHTEDNDDGTIIKLNNVLDYNDFIKITSDPVFEINRDSGIIVYHPNNLNWKNGVVGYSNNNNWHSTTGEISAEYFQVNLNYNIGIDNNNNLKNEILLGTIKPTSITEPIYKIKIKDCSFNYELINMVLNNSNNNYIQLYIVSNGSDNIDKALLISDSINISNILNNLDIELSSINERSISQNHDYYLKMYLNIQNYNIDFNTLCGVQKSTDTTYKAPPDSSYGVIKISNTTSNSNINKITENGLVDNISIIYNLSKNGSKYTLKVKSSNIYDFIVWQQGVGISSPIIGGGQTGINGSTNWGKFFTTQEEILTGLSDSLQFELMKPLSSENPLCISFYSENYCTDSIIDNVSTPSSSSSTNNDSTGIIEYTITYDDDGKENIVSTIRTDIKDTVTETSELNTNTVIKYKLSNNYLDIINKNLYKIDFSWNENQYKQIQVSWGIKLSKINMGNIYDYKKINDSTKLCIVEDLETSGLQGIPYAKTWWKNDVPMVTFYWDYYKWILEKKKNLFGYIDLEHNINSNNNDNIYYKYIRTLVADDVKRWFDAGDSTGTNIININISENESKNIYKEIVKLKQDLVKQENWREFIRIGLDENGRFFNAGLQDKRTYNRTGRITGFGKIANLYGQEIRTQQTLKTFSPILKTFTQINNLNTTYITQGKNDNGNISIRSADKGSIELGVSQFSNTNDNLIPNLNNYIKIDNNEIKLSTRNSSFIDIKDSLSIQTDIFSITSYNKNEINNKQVPKFNISISDNGNSIIQSSAYLVTSNLTNTYNINEPHYRINASNIKGSNPIIQLQVGNNQAGVDINLNEVKLKLDDRRYITIKNNDDNFTAKFHINNMQLNFDESEKTVVLKNDRSYIQIIPESNQSNYYDVQLFSNRGSNITVGNKIILHSNNEINLQGLTRINNHVYIRKSLYTNNNIYIGYDDNNDKNKSGAIYLSNITTVSGKTEKHSLKILAEHLKQVYDWYNNRWCIGVEGNTVFMRNVSTDKDKRNHPDGYYDSASGKYRWNYLRFNETGYWV